MGKQSWRRNQSWQSLVNLKSNPADFMTICRMGLKIKSRVAIEVMELRAHIPRFIHSARSFQTSRIPRVNESKIKTTWQLWEQCK